jgi:hypothetical protein
VNLTATVVFKRSELTAAGRTNITECQIMYRPEWGKLGKTPKFMRIL